MSPHLKGHAAMLLFSLLIAGSFSLVGLIAGEVAPAALNAVRFGLAALIVGTMALATTGIPRSAARAPWRYLILGGLFAGYFVLMFEGLKTAEPVSIVAVFTLTPIMTAGFGYILLSQLVTNRMYLALGVGAIGALWVIFKADIAALFAFEVGKGEMIFFWGCVLHALYTPMMRKLNRGEPAFVFTFGTFIAGFLLLTIYGWNDIRATNWLALPWLVWVTLGYISVFAGLTTLILLQYSAMRLPSAKVMAYTYLTPSWVILWELALGHGAPTPLILPGIALTILALWLLLKDD